MVFIGTGGFDAAANDPLLDMVCHSMLVWISGAAESSGRGWSIDEEIVARIAQHDQVDVSAIRTAFTKLGRGGYITLRANCEQSGRHLGRVLFYLHDTSAAEWREV